jgi:hypothetical protein
MFVGIFFETALELVALLEANYFARSRIVCDNSSSNLAPKYTAWHGLPFSSRRPRCCRGERFRSA